MSNSNIIDEIEKQDQYPETLSEEQQRLENVEKIFKDSYYWDTDLETYVKTEPELKTYTDIENNNDVPEFQDIEINEEVTSLDILRENRLMSLQNMFKKSIRVSLKSFLISLSISFLNFFI